jgi:hypothetical protein
MQALKPEPDLEDDEAFLRRLIFPEEDRHLFTTAPWRGGYRWFRACLEKARRLKSQTPGHGR